MSPHQPFVHPRPPAGAALLLPVEKQMLVALAVYALLAPLAAAHFDALSAVPLEPLRAFVLGVLLGVLTGLGLVLRRRWGR